VEPDPFRSEIIYSSGLDPDPKIMSAPGLATDQKLMQKKNNYLPFWEITLYFSLIITW
jgi:hypothetical protein